MTMHPSDSIFHFLIMFSGLNTWDWITYYETFPWKILILSLISHWLPEVVHLEVLWIFPHLCWEYLLHSVLLLLYKYFWDYKRLISFPPSISLLQTLPFTFPHFFKFMASYYLTVIPSFLLCSHFLIPFYVTYVIFNAIKRENYASEF